MATNAFIKKVTGAGDSEHTKNARPSTLNPHQEGQARKDRDKTKRKTVIEGSKGYKGPTNNKRPK